MGRKDTTMVSQSYDPWFWLCIQATSLACRLGLKNSVFSTHPGQGTFFFPSESLRYFVSQENDTEEGDWIRNREVWLQSQAFSALAHTCPRRLCRIIPKYNSTPPGQCQSLVVQVGCHPMSTPVLLGTKYMPQSYLTRDLHCFLYSSLFRVHL